MRPYLALQFEIALCLAVGVALGLADPLVLRAIVDRALGDGDRGLLFALVGLLGIVLVFRIAFRVLSVWLTSYSGLRILFELRQRVYEHVQTLSAFFFRGERYGDVLARLTSDIDLLQRAAAHTLVNAVQDLLTIAGILALLFWLDAPLALGMLAVTPPLAWALSRVNRRLRNEAGAAREASGDLYAFLEERLAAVRLIQTHRRERAQALQHVRVSRPWIARNLALSFLGSVQVSIADVVTTGAFVLVFLAGGLRALDGALSLGSLVAFYTLATRLYRPIAGLIDVNIDLQLAAGSLERVYQLLDVRPDVTEAPDARVPALVRGAFAFRAVDFVLDGQRLLDRLDLRVEAGRVLGLAGSSGAGKSTAAALLARHADASAGCVEVDGLDVRRWKLSALRRAVLLVPQETQLFHDSLAANLRFAAPRASDAELVDALEAVELGALLAGLPQGSRRQGRSARQAAVGWRASAGRARPSAARASRGSSCSTRRRARSTPCRSAWAQAHARTPEGKVATVVLIAHRLRRSNRGRPVVVLDRGRVVEEGAHAELVARRGPYRALFERELERGRADEPPIGDASSAATRADALVHSPEFVSPAAFERSLRDRRLRRAARKTGAGHRPARADRCPAGPSRHGGIPPR